MYLRTAMSRGPERKFPGGMATQERCGRWHGTGRGRGRLPGELCRKHKDIQRDEQEIIDWQGRGQRLRVNPSWAEGLGSHVLIGCFAPRLEDFVSPPVTYYKSVITEVAVSRNLREESQRADENNSSLLVESATRSNALLKHSNASNQHKVSHQSATLCRSP